MAACEGNTGNTKILIRIKSSMNRKVLKCFLNVASLLQSRMSIGNEFQAVSGSLAFIGRGQLTESRNTSNVYR